MTITTRTTQTTSGIVYAALLDADGFEVSHGYASTPRDAIAEAVAKLRTDNEWAVADADHEAEADRIMTNAGYEHVVE